MYGYELYSVGAFQSSNGDCAFNWSCLCMGMSYTVLERFRVQTGTVPLTGAVCVWV